MTSTTDGVSLGERLTPKEGRERGEEEEEETERLDESYSTYGPLYRKFAD